MKKIILMFVLITSFAFSQQVKDVIIEHDYSIAASSSATYTTVAIDYEGADSIGFYLEVTDYNLTYDSLQITAKYQSVGAGGGAEGATNTHSTWTALTTVVSKTSLVYPTAFGSNTIALLLPSQARFKIIVLQTNGDASSTNIGTWRLHCLKRWNSRK